MKERIQGIIIGIVITLFLIGTLSFASQHSEYVERFYNNIKITLNGIIIEPKDANGNIVAITSMASGGYTGAWGPEGRLAVLHEKELNLNGIITLLLFF